MTDKDDIKNMTAKELAKTITVESFTKRRKATPFWFTLKYERTYRGQPEKIYTETKASWTHLLDESADAAGGIHSLCGRASVIRMSQARGVEAHQGYGPNPCCKRCEKSAERHDYELPDHWKA